MNHFSSIDTTPYTRFSSNIPKEMKDTYLWIIEKLNLPYKIFANAYDICGNLIEDSYSLWREPDIAKIDPLRFDALDMEIYRQITESLEKQGIPFKEQINLVKYLGCEKDYVGPDAECVTKESAWEGFLKWKPLIPPSE